MYPILIYSPAFRMIPTMKTMFQVGLNDRACPAGKAISYP